MSSNSFAKKVRYALRFIPDEPYIQLNYFAHFHKFANLKNPKTYNEKLNWLKLHDHNPLYTTLVDKYEVKKFIENKLGKGYCVPTLGVFDKFDDIDFDKLPNQFVLKCTHDSEGIVIVKDKSQMNLETVRLKLTRALNQNFYYIGREWPYKNVKPRIIAEPYLEDKETGELRDYKFFCFNGIPKIMYIASGRAKNQITFDFFDLDFNHLDIKQKYPNSKILMIKPKTFEKMIELSEIISKDFLHVRIDFYEVDGRIYIGELTFYPMSGLSPYYPEKWDLVLGNWIQLPDNF